MNASYPDLSPIMKPGASPFVIEEIVSGEWCTLPVPDCNLARLCVPFRTENIIRIKIMYEGLVQIPFARKRDENDIFRDTFPDVNPLFNPGTKKSTGSGYFFEVIPPRGTPIKTLAEARQKIPPELKQTYYGDVKPVELAALQKIGRIYGVHRQDDIAGLLRSIYNAVGNLVKKGNGKGLQEYSSLESLLQEYEEKKIMTGDCKSISTVTTGFLTAFGIPSRRIGGEIISKQPEQHQFPYARNGHSWSEAYLPCKEGGGGWFPIDAALHTFLEYRADVEYMVWTYMPLFEGNKKKVEIRIDHG